MHDLVILANPNLPQLTQSLEIRSNLGPHLKTTYGQLVKQSGYKNQVSLA